MDVSQGASSDANRLATAVMCSSDNICDFNAFEGTGAGCAPAEAESIYQSFLGARRTLTGAHARYGLAAMLRSDTAIRCMVLCLLGVILPMVGSAYAFDQRSEQSQLAERIRLRPTDYEATYRYVAISTELRDYEAAIGALERLLMFNPGLARAEKDLGFLYARLGAYQLAEQHLRAALSSPEINAGQRAQIEAQLSDIGRAREPNRLSGELSLGLRSQSNANFFPLQGLFDVGGVAVSNSGQRADVNAYELLQVNHDYGFGAQYAHVLETRATAYATQQFRLSQYDVGLISGSVGPRFQIWPDVLPGFSIKPYATGVASSLDGETYLDAGGGGVTVRIPLGPDTTIDPGFEWRSLYVNQGNPTLQGPTNASLSTLASGDAMTGYLGGTYRATDHIRFDWQAAYTHLNADLASQSWSQFDIRAMLRVEFAPPFIAIPRRWAIAPYLRFTDLAFDAPNPVVNPGLARHDTMWTGGALFTAPITAQFGFVGNLEFARNNSNLPNYRTQNFSISFGPVAKF